MSELYLTALLAAYTALLILSARKVREWRASNRRTRNACRESEVIAKRHADAAREAAEKAVHAGGAAIAARIGADDSARGAKASVADLARLIDDPRDVLPFPTVMGESPVPPVILPFDTQPAALKLCDCSPEGAD